MKKPHGLAIAFPAQGHLAPLMELCLKLTAASSCPSDGDGDGISITFANDHLTHNTLLRNHLGPSIPHPRSPRFRMVHFDDPVRQAAHTAGRDAIVDIMHAMPAFRQPLEELVQKLLDDPEDPITFILSDAFTPLAGALASRFGLPLICFWPQCAASLATMVTIAKHGRRMANPDDPIPGLSPLRWIDLSKVYQIADPDDSVFQYFLQCFKLSEDATCTIINTCYEFEKDYVQYIQDSLQKNVLTIGPVLPDWCFYSGKEEPTPSHHFKPNLWTEDHSCLQWLDAQKENSVLYVSLGSVATLELEQFMELALGLELCEQPILWVIRADLIDGKAAVRFPEGYLDRMQSRACFVSWAPQKEVLFHRAVGGFFTHHGWNSTMESMAAGVPMLGWPYFADQMTNARLCVEVWNVGLGFGGDRKRLIGRDEVDEKVRLLMQSTSILREKIGQCKRLIHQGVSEGGSSNLHLKQLLHRICNL